jgi:hypothetical protein
MRDDELLADRPRDTTLILAYRNCFATILSLISLVADRAAGRLGSWAAMTQKLFQNL